MAAANRKRPYSAIRVSLVSPIETRDDLSLAYTPGVADLCREISANPAAAYDLTIKRNAVAVVSDGTRVLGLGSIGPLAGLPVMEGKAALFRRFGGVDAFPICLNAKTADEIVASVKAISPSFGGINLEDIEAPKCYEVERRLVQELDIPVMHDDQHGTAIVALAGVINSLKLAGKSLGDCKIIMNGAGAAGSSIARLLVAAGATNVIVFDRTGAICAGREGMDANKQSLAKITNKGNYCGGLEDACKEADVLIGASSRNAFTPQMIMGMAGKPIVFALANPLPEIERDAAKQAGAFIYASGRSDSPNQINNALVFPGVFRGALDVRASRITEGMKMAAAYALSEVIPGGNLSPDFMIPNPFDSNAHIAVAFAVAKEAIREKVARVAIPEKELLSGIASRIRGVT
jgi:malate dehydrogenase (oxaloacetate-decarboxylating)